MNKVTLLLTACVNPYGMSFTALQNPIIRKEQYICALLYYLKNTELPIVFVENTNSDFSNLFQNYIDNGRLEYLTFMGNNYPKSLGKGYGEAEIITYGLKNSLLIRETNYLIKITGRLIVRNINEIANNPILRLSSRCIRFSFMSDKSVFSMCIVAPVRWISDCISKYGCTINDSDKVYMEHILYRYLIETEKHCIFPFFTPPRIEGVSGTTGKLYIVKSNVDSFLDSIHGLYVISKKREILRKSFAYKSTLILLCYKIIYRTIPYLRKIRRIYIQFKFWK